MKIVGMPSHQMKRLFESLESIRENSKKYKINNIAEDCSDDNESTSSNSRRLSERLQAHLSEMPSTSNEKPAAPQSSSQTSSRPAELFRTDFITNMKVPDNEYFETNTCFTMEDHWRNEWNRGVQVPVDPQKLPERKVIELFSKPSDGGPNGRFKLPRKLIRMENDDFFDQTRHQISPSAKEPICIYDLDDLDIRWLRLVNELRQLKFGMHPMSERDVEKVIEVFELQCNECVDKQLANDNRLGIEYDEDTVCDVCLSPDCDTENEIIFCDGCEVCIHQGCYGVTRVPSGSWRCRPCAMGVSQPTCILCPNKGGAMKNTRSGTRWAHISCALWIPEIGFGDPDHMEPITNIASVPEERWLLRCAICHQRGPGACIQCTVPSCSTAYHVTCAQRHGLDIRVESIDDAEDVKMISFCTKHSQPKSSPRTHGSPNYRQSRQQRILEVRDFFFSGVNLNEVAERLKIPFDIVSTSFEYWKLKRKSKFNEPLLTQKRDEEKLIEKLQEEGLMKRVQMLISLRQNLEKARNLCYMVVRREKLKKQWYQMLSDTYKAQVSYTKELARPMTKREQSSMQKYFDECMSVYDRLMRSKRPVDCDGNPTVDLGVPRTSSVTTTALNRSMPYVERSPGGYSAVKHKRNNDLRFDSIVLPASVDEPVPTTSSDVRSSQQPPNGLLKHVDCIAEVVSPSKQVVEQNCGWNREIPVGSLPPKISDSETKIWTRASLTRPPLDGFRCSSKLEQESPLSSEPSSSPEVVHGSSNTQGNVFENLSPKLSKFKSGRKSSRLTSTIDLNGY